MRRMMMAIKLLVGRWFGGQIGRVAWSGACWPTYNSSESLMSYLCMVEFFKNCQYNFFRSFVVHSLSSSFIHLSCKEALQCKFNEMNRDKKTIDMPANVGE